MGAQSNHIAAGYVQLHGASSRYNAAGHLPCPAAVSNGVQALARPHGAPVLHLLVVDEDAAVRDACLEIAGRMGFAAVGASDVAAARNVLRKQKLDLMLLDLLAGNSGGGLTLLEEVKSKYPETQVVVMTAFATVAHAVEAMRVGAGDYLTKPFALEELKVVLERAGEHRHFDLESRSLRQKLRNQQGAGNLIGSSLEMEKLYRILSKVAYSTHPVLILGESGTGKELVARAIHFNGPQAERPFVPVDCGSLIPQRIEAELFGSAPSAVHPEGKMGLLTSLDGGTLLLDEITELPFELQSRLLRALQERSVRPAGGGPGVPVTARVLASSDRDLVLLVEQGRFRRDLYFRLNVVNLRIPPLRERTDDIPVLAHHFLERRQRESGSRHEFSDAALRTMLDYDWPGNVRELENAIERACALSSGPIVHMGDLPTQLQEMRQHQYPTIGEEELQQPASAAPMPERIVSIAEMERNAILATIRQLKGDKLLAAKLLGIGKTTLYRKLKEYGIPEGTEFNEA